MAFVRLLALFGAISCSAAKQWCARGDACWPTSDDITALKAALDPAAPRVLKWNGTGTPRPSSVPIGSPGDQPLYSFGAQGLAALYVNDTLDDPSSCMQPGEKRAVCTQMRACVFISRLKCKARRARNAHTHLPEDGDPIGWIPSLPSRPRPQELMES